MPGERFRGNCGKEVQVIELDQLQVETLDFEALRQFVVENLSDECKDCQIRGVSGGCEPEMEIDDDTSNVISEKRRFYALVNYLKKRR